MADYTSNDLPQYPGHQSSSQSQSNPVPNDGDTTAPAAVNDCGDGDSYVPRPKRIACVVCRRRKLKCDGQKPSCGTCSRLGHPCAYDEVRKKSGPKRGYVKQLEARLAQVEMLLNGQEPTALPAPQTQPPENALNVAMPHDIDPTDIPEIPALDDDIGPLIPPTETIGQAQPGQEYLPDAGFDAMDTSAWDMLSLGLEEPLPTQSVIDELNRIYFEKIHPSIPIMHRPKYLAASNLAPNLRPPVYLQYIMWCHAASVSDKYYHLHGHFYQRARKYAELEEMKGLGENVLSLAYCQTWLFIATYESRMLYFPRAWLSTGKSARLALMLGLNRLDGVGLGVKQSLPPPKDWTEKEERRRAFWMVFCCDRYSSIGTSWPMLIDERDIMTNLPATEESFIKGKPHRTLRLADVLAGEGTSTLSPLGSVVLLAALFGRNLTHLHRPDPQDNDYDLNGEFWKRHRSYDNILLNIALQLPNHLRLPTGMGDPNVIFSNMCIHTSTICLHQAAIFKAEKNKMPEQLITESKRRCIVAADQISSMMKLISHMDLTVMNPFLSFCVYVAARVFVQYLKSRPDDSMAQSSLQFVLSALKALKNKNPLTETFLVQLDVDTEGMVFQGAQKPAKRGRSEYDVAPGVITCATDVKECPPFLGLPDSQFNDRVETSSHDGSLAGSANQPNPHPASLFSNQRKQAGAQHLDLNTATTSNGGMGSFVGPHITNPGAIIDMDLAPNPIVNDKSNTPSDHPTPSTLNSSSNTSYIRADHHPPPQQSQHPSSTTTTATNHSTQAPVDPLSIPSTDSSASHPNKFNNSPSVAGQFSANTEVPPFYSTGTPTSFPMPSPSTWESSTSQVPATSPGNMTPGFLNDSHLAQLLSSNNWDSWRN